MKEKNQSEQCKHPCPDGKDKRLQVCSEPATPIPCSLCPELTAVLSGGVTRAPLPKGAACVSGILVYSGVYSRMES